MSELMLYVRGMDCGKRVREVTARLRDVPGVVVLAANASDERVVLTGSMSTVAVLAALAGTPYSVRVVPDSHGTASGQHDQ